MAKVIINNKGAKRVRQGHLWVYRSDLIKIDALGGDVVAVFDESRNFVGKAFFSDKSEISLRFFATKDETVNDNFWREKIIAAINRRTKADSGKTNAYRLVNSEGDLIPGLIVDFYDGNLVMQTLIQATEKLKETFTEILKSQLQPKSITERNDAKVRLLEGLELKKSVLYGSLDEEIIIEQNDIKFQISLLKGQKTGFFLDQRENRLAARKYAFGRGLDCFTFNGGFALNIAGNCESVLAIDISEEAIAQARKNAELNQILNLAFRTGNVFDILRELAKSGEKFDTIILDPPAFVKNRSSLKGALRGYKEINLRAMKLLNKDGILITCSCSHHLSEEIFLKILEESALDAHRRLQLIEKRMQSSDHPVLLGMPETSYLKCFILKAIN